MEKLMILTAALACLSCTGGNTSRSVSVGETTPALVETGVSRPLAERPLPDHDAFPWAGETLEKIAEMERSGVYGRGMGMAESAFRENAGDYAGAVLAAYKELAWMYGHGLISKEALEKGLTGVMTHKDNEDREEAVRTARGLLAFVGGRWEEAENILGSLFIGDDEPDSFARWLLLTCALEKEPSSRTAGAAYGAIRARYSSFPEYWYRGARAFSGQIAADYAERCVSLAPAGPFAGECRRTLAAFAGLEPQDGASLKSLAEIENLLAQAVSGGDPGLLAGIMPLISLPDNPYTVYAVGALRALAEAPRFRDYFEDTAKKSSGRLAERLRYICGGRG